MTGLIDAAFARPRTVLLTLLLVLVTGSIAYRSIPKESDPDINVPIVYVSIGYEGISPEDSERLLIRPVEKELRGIEGVKEITAVAQEGYGAITLEFEAGFDVDQALNDVREKVDLAKPELPDGTDEPEVHEVNLALFPVLVVTLSGQVSERTLLTLARDLQDEIEALPNVLEVEIAGEREEVLEVTIDPEKLESYGLNQEELFTTVARNNQLVAAGALDTGQGRFAVKLPGVFESFADVQSLAIKTVGDKVVTFADVASIRRTFKDPTGFARVDGQPALALEVTKRIGVNIIETIEQVRAVVEAERAAWPATIQVGYSQDKSDDIRMMLRDLQNNVLSAILLVMIVVVAALGLRSAGLVGIAVPGSFLTGILVLYALGLTVNIVVLFALILAVGMLVDGAIVVTELADRKLSEGLAPVEAYRTAAKRMAWPITASTATTLAAFMPLLFWPGIVGEFMKYLPITLLATLSASLLMALVFVPILGSVIGRPRRAAAGRGTVDEHDLNRFTGLTRGYIGVLRACVRRPLVVALSAVVIAISAYTAYGTFGRGVEFFPEVEPELAQVHVHARGDLAAIERDALVQRVERRVLGTAGIERLYTRSDIEAGQGDDVDEDVIGTLLLEFTDWTTRRPASEILAEIRARTADIAGIKVETKKEDAGPAASKDILLRLVADDPQVLPPAVERVRDYFERRDGLIDVSDSRAVPGIEWRLRVDRADAGRFGADVAMIGSYVQLVTNGVLLGTYRPNDADDEIDIRARFPQEDRGLSRLDRLRIETPQGAVPITNFVERSAVPRVGSLERVNGKRVITVAANVQEGLLVNDQVQAIKAWLAEQDFAPGIEVSFTGTDEDQAEAAAFLQTAFGAALFLIALILVTQFNSFYQAFLILSAIVFSTVGVLLGLLITDQPFGIVMSGVGVIALAGIVVNNNIVLIDTYNDLRRKGLDAERAILLTGAQRLRPVLLTTVTTILGLMPMVLKLNIDLFTRTITQGGPSTDWWAQLASAVAGGLLFATLLTLVLTPSLLMLRETLRRTGQRLRGRHARRSGRDGQAEAGAPQPTPAE